MSNILQMKRGAAASLPTLNQGEFSFTTDTHKIYIGDGAANHQIALSTDVVSGDGTDGYIPNWNGTGSILEDSPIYTDGTKVSIGLANAPYNLSVQSESSETTLGSEILVNNEFTSDLASWTAGANWAWNTGTALHSTGSVETIYQGVATTINNHYQIQIVITGRTTGSVYVTLENSSGGENFRLYNGTYNYSFKAGSTATNNLIFTPSTDFNGALDLVSFKLITAASTPSFVLYNDDGSISGVQIKPGGTGRNNIFIGSNSGRQNTTGYHNNALGYQSLYSNTTGYYNNALGRRSLYSNTTGNYNNALGYQSLYSNTTGYHNNALGYQSLYSNTTGYYNNALGRRSLYSNTTGNYNNALGYSSLYFNTTGYHNNALGGYALYELTEGINNTALGYNSGRGITTGSNNTIIGANVTGLSSILANTIIIADGDGNQRIYVNNNGKVGLNTQTGLSTLNINGGLHIGGDSDAGDNNLLVDGTTTITNNLTVDTNSLFVDSVNHRVSIGTTSPDRLSHTEESTALTNTVQQVARLSHITSGTPANNIGLGLEFEQETSASNNEIIATIEAIATDTTAASEDGSLSFKLMTAGAAATEKLKITSTTGLTVSNIVHEVTDVDKILVSNAGNIKYRTGAEILSDIGGQTSLTPAALTRVDDTNVTLALGGTPATSLLEATSLTLGWTGTLSIARGGTNSGTTLGNNMVMVSSGDAIVESPSISTTELGLLNGMSSIANAGLTNLSAVNMDINTTLLTKNSANNLGSSTYPFGNLYLKDGGTINFNNSDIILTHSANLLALSGGNLESPAIKLTTGATDGYYLRSDASGNGTWVAGTGSGATTSLNNLASVAINTALLPEAYNTIRLGSLSHSFEGLSLSNSADIKWSGAIVNGFCSLTWSGGDLQLGGADLDLHDRDLKFGTGGVINFASGDVTLTHSSKKLTIAGGSFETPGLIVTGSTALTSVSTGDADNDKLVTKGYVDDADDASISSTSVNAVGWWRFAKCEHPTVPGQTGSGGNANFFIWWRKASTTYGNVQLIASAIYYGSSNNLTVLQYNSERGAIGASDGVIKFRLVQDDGADDNRITYLECYTDIALDNLDIQQKAPFTNNWEFITIVAGSIPAGYTSREITPDTGITSYNSIKVDDYKINALNTAPTSANDTGTTGEIRYTSTYIYVCTAPNTWKRSTLATW